MCVGTERNRGNFNRCGWCPARNSNPAPHEYFGTEAPQAPFLELRGEVVYVYRECEFNQQQETYPSLSTDLPSPYV